MDNGSLAEGGCATGLIRLCERETLFLTSRLLVEDVAVASAFGILGLKLREEVEARALEGRAEEGWVASLALCK